VVTSHESGKGFGASTKLHALDPINFAMRTGRVVLFMNSAPYGPAYVRKRHKGASCARGDLQCMFLPMSPCVLSKDDMENATEISPQAYKSFLATGKLDDEVDKKKVIMLAVTGGKEKEPPLVRERYVELISSFYEKRESSNVAWNIDEEVLDKVKEVIMNEPWLPDGVAYFYMIRPNLGAQQEMARILNKIVPADFNPESSIGLAIRASDKCGRESDCMPFSSYGQLIREFAAKRTLARTGDNTTNSSLYDTVVLTSESKQVMEERFNYTEKEDFPFRFIVNDEDPRQGSGKPGNYRVSGSNADGVMLSSLTAIKMQMMSESTVLNSCSNFHMLMNSLLIMGCSKSKNNFVETLHRNDNPAFRMKCGMGIHGGRF